MKGGRRVVAGLTDQVLVAFANAGITVLALDLFTRVRSAGVLLCIGLAYFVITVNRAFVGDVLVALVARYEGEARAKLIRSGLATAVSVGVLAGVVMLAVWLLRPRAGKIDLEDLVWIAPFLPAILLQDTVRSSYIAGAEQAKALLNDVVGVATQALVISVLLAVGVRTPGAVFASWGIGASTGAVVFLVRTRQWPWRGSVRLWLVETRHLAGWFTATQVVGQLQLQAVSFIVTGRLSQTDLSGLRGAQTALIQPTQNFAMAVQSLIVPRFSRLAGEAGASAARGDAEALAAQVATLRRQTMKLALGLGVAAIAVVAVYAPLARLVLGHIEKFKDIVPLALPLSIQAGFYLIEVPFAAALRGMHRARLLFVRYLVFTTATMTALVIGASVDRLQGAAWGLVTGAGIGVTTMIAFYFLALHRLAKGAPTPEEPAALASAAI